MVGRLIDVALHVNQQSGLVVKLTDFSADRGKVREGGRRRSNIRS